MVIGENSHEIQRRTEDLANNLTRKVYVNIAVSQNMITSKICWDKAQSCKTSLFLKTCHQNLLLRIYDINLFLVLITHNLLSLSHSQLFLRAPSPPFLTQNKLNHARLHLRHPKNTHLNDYGL